MSQRQILENSINLLNTLKGPAKILYADASCGFPTIVDNVINPTTGAAGTSWVAFGLTRGGVNVNKTLTMTPRNDVDQLLGTYDQDITERGYKITTQIAEVFNDTAQLAIALDMGAATYVMATTSQPTQVMRPLDDSDNKATERRWAVVYPKATNGKVLAFVFRRGALAGGDLAFRFDKSDPASPAFELNLLPEIATTIDAGDSFGRLFEMPG
jgi:hypothetical protein